MALPPSSPGSARDGITEIRACTAHLDFDFLGVSVVCLDPTGLLAGAVGWDPSEKMRPAAHSALVEMLGRACTVSVGPYNDLLTVGFDVRDIAPETVERLISECLTRQLKIDGGGYFVPACQGLAISSVVTTATDVADLVQAAISAVHYAIVDGDTVAHATPDSIARLQTEVSRTTELSNAVGTDFALYYQPIIDITTMKTVGYESLLRWQVADEVRKPHDFLDAAEATSLIVPIGRWGVQAALEQLAIWRAASTTPGLFVSVNFSARQLQDRTLPELVAAILESTGVPADALWVEVTERDLIEVGSPASATLIELDALGCTVCVDDLGTGFAALRYMVEQPVQVVKIDRSLIAKVGADDNTMHSIVKAVCALSSSLGMATVAEGVEDPGQIAHLRELGFTHGQGYLFGKPAPADEITIDAS
ncbi:EAL domain-containing protein [Williamsia sp. 1135]|uniref:EAL domain-containing protein n=1 Tax=Williamsia sp. 1135 TaxID=1889262 RepID=UPI00143CB23D|nr:EAL domain-containing protein [Williamsia sp. 1135]